MNALIVVTAVLVVGAIVFAPALVRLLAGDFAAVPGQVRAHGARSRA